MLALQKNDIFAERYQLQEVIGSRGTSEVWMAADLLEDREIVALKIYAVLDKSDQPFLERLQKDIEYEQPLQHPHLLQLDYFNVYHGAPYVVMPYMNGGSLRGKFLQDGPLTELQVAIILKQIGSALQALHAAEPPYLHQNIKPDNILVVAEDDYVLADFRIHNQLKAVLPRVTGQAETSTIAYASPEQFTVRPGTYKASDIFSFGVTLYEMCSGQLPWMGNGGLSLLQGAAVPYLPVSYSRELNNIITACMDPKWENRPTAEELVREGNYFIDNNRWKPYGRFSVAKVDVVKYDKRSPVKTAIWVLAVLAALSVAGYLLYTKTDIIQNTFNQVAITPDPTETDSTEATIVSDTSSNEGNEELMANTTEAQEIEREAESPPPVQPQERENTPERAVVTTAPAIPTEQMPKRVATAETRQPAYKKPATAEEFLARMQNNDIPLDVKERWKADIWRFFDRKAAVNYVVNGELIGILSADELIDIMMDAEDTTAIRVDSTNRNAEGKVDQVYVSVQEK